MDQQIIYLDNAATTKVDEKVVKAMLPYFSEKYGNASSMHNFGRLAREAVDNSRKIIAKSLNANEEEIYFTSGGTESNNLALKGLFLANKSSGKNHIITTKIEHDCILQTCRWLEKQGAKITYIDVDKHGLVNPLDITKAITPNTLVVSIIQGNNEIGTLQDTAEIGRICKSKGVYFHIDACQSFTKSFIDVEKQNLDLVTINAHKIHGPKGVGALYVRKGVNIQAIQNGGGHEHGLRSGTENVPGIAGFGKAVEIADKKQLKNIEKLRDYLIKNILKIPRTRLNGASKERLCNNVNISFRDIEGEAIASHLENYGIIVSTGSACASHTLKKSHVLRAIGLNDLEINSSIRISLSKFTTKKEIDKLIRVLPSIVNTLRTMSPVANNQINRKGGKMTKIKDKFTEFAGSFKNEGEFEEELEEEGLDPEEVENKHFEEEN